MDLEKTKAVPVRAWEEFINQARPEVADEIYADRFEFHDPAHVFISDVVDTPDQMKRMVADFRRAFPDLKYHILDVVAEGDDVVLRWRQTSTHTEPLVPGHPAGGEKVDVTGIDWFTVRDGRIVREIAEWNMLGMVQQIGLAPAQPGPPPGAMPSRKIPPAGDEDTAAIKATARSLFEDLLNRQGSEALAGVYADDAWFFNAAVPVPLQGRAAIAGYVDQVRTTFPDLRYDVLRVIAEGDRAVVHWRMSGTHTGEGLTPGLPPTGGPIEATGMDWILFRDGRIVEERSEWDVFRVMQQLGLIPPVQASSLERTASAP